LTDAQSVTISEDGACRLEALSELHLEEVPRLTATMRGLFAEVDDADADAISSCATP
jgi:hypothetical protein